MIGMIVNYTFLFTAILLCGALSGFLSERVGIVNIGIDGMMCFGALFFGILSSPVLGMSNFGPGMLIIPLLITMVFTAIAGLMHGFATIKLKANHIISGTAINLIGLALATFLNAKLGNLLYDGSANLKSGFGDCMFIGDSIYGSSIILFVGVLVIAAILFTIMMFTKVGLRYRAVGENPNAVDAQFINVNKYQWTGVILSSMMAGLAGALFLFNAHQFQGNTQGLGFLSLAILIAGAWKVEWITIVSVCFALFTALPQTVVLTNLGVPREVGYAIPYVITVVVLLGFSKWVRPPAHSGIPFDKSKR